jgi:hypothetical protein
MKHSLRSPINGKFIPRPQVANIVAGRLYGFKGAVVRAKKDQIFRDGVPQRFVSFHKALIGYVPEAELQVVEPTKVKEYLQNV